VQDRDESLLVEEDLCKAAEQMASFDLYVGNDSGTTHLAAAIGLPTVAIFGTTDPQIWRPLGEHVTVVATEPPADSMENVSLEQVHEAVSARMRK
jgi:ADP-heptose:LPS heptosyltransferase